MKMNKKALSAAITLSLVLGAYGVAGATESLYGATSGNQYLKADGSATEDPNEAAVVAAAGKYVSTSSNSNNNEAKFEIKAGSWSEVRGSKTKCVATNNNITISGKTTKVNKIWGAIATGFNAEKNTVTLNSGTVTGWICGANSTSDTGCSAKDNEVYINGGEVATIYGGFGQNYSSAENNKVYISGGMVTSTVYGGYSMKGGATSNTVTISGTASITGDVNGGYANGTGAASSNEVTIMGGTVSGTVHGGSTWSGNATGNTINLGGYKDKDSGEITTAETWKATINGDVYINYANNTSLGGTLNVYSVGNTINENTTKSLAGALHADGASVNFYIPATAKSDDAMLTVSGTADLSGATINTSTTNYNGDTITLISAGMLTTTNATYQIDGGTAGEAASVTKTIDITKAGITDNTLQATVGYDVATKAISFGAKSYQLKDNTSVTGDVTLKTVTGADAELNLNGKTINMQQGESATVTYNTLTVAKLTGTGSLAIDVDLSGSVKNDTISITGTDSGATLNLSSVLVRSDGLTDGDNADAVTYVQAGSVGDVSGITYSVGTDGTIQSATTDYTYTFKAGDKGKLTVTKVANAINVSDFIQGKNSYKTVGSLTIDKNTSVASELGTTFTDSSQTTRTKDLTLGINAGITLSGNKSGTAVDGITVDSGYSLTLKGETSGTNVATMSGFTTALTNNDTLNVSDLTMSGNTTDIVNNGTATLTNVAANTINNNSALTIAAGDNKAVITGNDGALTFGDGTNVVEITNNGTVSQKDVVVAAKATLVNKKALTASNGVKVADLDGTLDNYSTITGKLTNDGTVWNRSGASIEGDVTNTGSMNNDGSINGAVVNSNVWWNNENSQITGDVTNKSDDETVDATLFNYGTVTGNIDNYGLFENDQTVTGNVTNNADAYVYNMGTVAGDVTNSGSWINYAGSSVTGAMTNNSTLQSEGDTTLGSVTGTGTTEVKSGITKVTIGFTQSKLTVDSGASFEQNGGSFVVNGDVNNNGSVTLNNLGGEVVQDIADAKNKITGKLTNNGTFTLNNTVLYAGGLEGKAVVTNDNASALYINAGELKVDELAINTAIAADSFDESSIGKLKDATMVIANAGSTPLAIANNNDYAFVKESEIVKSGENAKVLLGEGAIVGQTDFVYDADGKRTINERQNQHNASLASSMADSVSFGRMEMNDIRKRLGDVRINNAKNGLWARYENGKNEGSGLDQSFNKFQIGGDTAQSDTWRLGGAVSYTKGSSDYAAGSTDTRTMSGAVYGVMTGKKGEYLDLIARVGVDKHDINAKVAKGDLSNMSFAVSAEVGKTYDFAKNFFVEPQAELTYTRTNGDDFNYEGRNYKLDDSNSLVGRLGFALGYKAPNNRGSIYTRFSVLHEFAGDKDLTVSNNTLALARTTENAGSGSWLEWAIGGQISTSKATYFYADLEKTFNADINEKYRLNVGLRYSF